MNTVVTFVQDFFNLDNHITTALILDIVIAKCESISIFFKSHRFSDCWFSLIWLEYNYVKRLIRGISLVLRLAIVRRSSVRLKVPSA